MPTGHSFLDFTPSVVDVGVVPANTTISVPVVVTRRPGRRSGASGDCHLSASVSWSPPCELITGMSVPIPFVTIKLCEETTVPGTCWECGWGWIRINPDVSWGPFPEPDGPPPPRFDYTEPLTTDTFTACQVAKCVKSLAKLAGYLSFLAPIECGGCIGKGVADAISHKTKPPLAFAMDTADCAFKCAKVIFPEFAALSAVKALSQMDKISKVAKDCLPSAPTRKRSSYGVADIGDLEREQRAVRYVQWALEVDRALAAMAHVFGDARWLEVYDPLWLELFRSCVMDSSDAGTLISPAESSQLEARSPSMRDPDDTGIAPIGPDDIRAFVRRWNATQQAWAAGQLDAGDNGTMDYQYLSGAIASIAEQVAAAQASGYADLASAYQASATEWDEATRGVKQGVCASVRLQIEQRLLFTRSAVRAVLTIENKGETELRNISVAIVVWPYRNRTQTATHLFSMGEPAATGIANASGALDLEPGGVGRLEWLILPLPEAAPAFEKTYDFGGSFVYWDGGERVDNPLYPVAVPVAPDPRLAVAYFWQRDVFSDDPFTEDVVEPAEPFVLAVLVSNRGYGTAYDMSLASSQPRIVDNRKGLLVDFAIVSTAVGNATAAASLVAAIGDVGPGATVAVEWLLTSTLSGEFVAFNASYTHRNALGRADLSLIDSLAIHELTHTALIPGGGDDLDDYLANDVPDGDNLPDAIYDSRTGSGRPVLASAAAAVGLGDGVFAVPVPAASGCVYVAARLPDDFGGASVRSAWRPDGRQIDGRNVWVTHRVVRLAGQEPRSENVLHVVDFDPAGNVTVSFGALGAAENLTVVSANWTWAAVAWGPARLATSYSVSIRQGGAAWRVLAASTASLRWFFTGLQPLGSYEVGVTAGRSGIWGPQSTVAFTMPALPEQPSSSSSSQRQPSGSSSSAPFFSLVSSESSSQLICTGELEHSPSGEFVQRLAVHSVVCSIVELCATSREPGEQRRPVIRGKRVDLRCAVVVVVVVVIVVVIVVFVLRGPCHSSALACELDPLCMWCGFGGCQQTTADGVCNVHACGGHLQNLSLAYEYNGTLCPVTRRHPTSLEIVVRITIQTEHERLQTLCMVLEVLSQLSQDLLDQYALALTVTVYGIGGDSLPTPEPLMEIPLSEPLAYRGYHRLTLDLHAIRWSVGSYYVGIAFVRVCPAARLHLLAGDGDDAASRRRQPAGWSALVRDPSAAANASNSSLTWSAPPAAAVALQAEVNEGVCGDGWVSYREQCDAGPYCTANCTCPNNTAPDNATDGCLCSLPLDATDPHGFVAPPTLAARLVSDGVLAVAVTLPQTVPARSSVAAALVDGHDGSAVAMPGGAQAVAMADSGCWARGSAAWRIADLIAHSHPVVVAGAQHYSLEFAVSVAWVERVQVFGAWANRSVASRLKVALQVARAASVASPASVLDTEVLWAYVRRGFVRAPDGPGGSGALATVTLDVETFAREAGLSIVPESFRAVNWTGSILNATNASLAGVLSPSGNDQSWSISLTFRSGVCSFGPSDSVGMTYRLAQTGSPASWVAQDLVLPLMASENWCAPNRTASLGLRAVQRSYCSGQYSTPCSRFLASAHVFLMAAVDPLGGLAFDSVTLESVAVARGGQSQLVFNSSGPVAGEWDVQTQTCPGSPRGSACYSLVLPGTLEADGVLVVEAAFTVTLDYRKRGREPPVPSVVVATTPIVVSRRSAAAAAAAAAAGAQGAGDGGQPLGRVVYRLPRGYVAVVVLLAAVAAACLAVTAYVLTHHRR
eukprot:m51a1_g11681 hypothetical protein (1757) ;mRNA; r:2244-8119